jgi:hypothetical protein
LPQSSMAAYRGHPADSKKKVKEDWFVPLQFKFNSQILHARVEYCIICTSLHRNIFLKSMWHTRCTVTHS